MPAKPLTPEQHEDASRLRARFKAWQEERKLHNQSSSQMEAAAQLGFGQSALSQYLRGDIPLNINVLPKFTMLLGCKYEEISPALASKINALVSNADYAIFDDRTGQWMQVETKRHPLSAEDAKTEGHVNTTTRDKGKHVINTSLQVAQRFAEELLAAVEERRVSDELLDALVKMFHVGAASFAPQGDQHHTKMVKARGTRKRGTGTG